MAGGGEEMGGVEEEIEVDSRTLGEALQIPD